MATGWRRWAWRWPASQGWRWRRWPCGWPRTTALALAASRRAGQVPPAAWLVPAFELYSLALLGSVFFKKLTGKKGIVWKGRHFD
ncbi:MAG: hypothetical protein WKG07_47990 [Hymenobacter sp.]